MSPLLLFYFPRILISNVTLPQISHNFSIPFHYWSGCAYSQQPPGVCCCRLGKFLGLSFRSHAPEKVPAQNANRRMHGRSEYLGDLRQMLCLNDADARCGSDQMAVCCNFARKKEYKKPRSATLQSICFNFLWSSEAPSDFIPFLMQTRCCIFHFKIPPNAMPSLARNSSGVLKPPAA